MKSNNLEKNPFFCLVGKAAGMLLVVGDEAMFVGLSDEELFTFILVLEAIFTFPLSKPYSLFCQARTIFPSFTDLTGLVIGTTYLSSSLPALSILIS